MLFSTALAQTAQQGAGSEILNFLPFIFLIFIMYFLLIRPQQKAAKERAAKISALKRGDVVVTNGGLIGKITKLTDDELTLQIAKDVNVQVLRSSFSHVKGEKTEEKK